MKNDHDSIIADRSADLRVMLTHGLTQFGGLSKDEALDQLLDAIDAKALAEEDVWAWPT